MAQERRGHRRRDERHAEPRHRGQRRRRGSDLGPVTGHDGFSFSAPVTSVGRHDRHPEHGADRRCLAERHRAADERHDHRHRRRERRPERPADLHLRVEGGRHHAADHVQRRVHHGHLRPFDVRTTATAATGHRDRHRQRRSPTSTPTASSTAPPPWRTRHQRRLGRRSTRARRTPTTCCRPRSRRRTTTATAAPTPTSGCKDGNPISRVRRTPRWTWA